MPKAPNTKPAKPAPEPSSSNLIHVEFPTKVTPFVGLAMLMGSLLVVMSMIGHNFFRTQTGHANLAFAAGIAIILAAFGGQATLRGKAFIFAGVAAIAAGLFFYLDRYSGAGKPALVEGRVENVPVDKYKASLKLGKTVYSKQTLDDKQFEFIAFQEELDRPQHATLEISSQQTGEVVASFSIPTECFTPWLGSVKIIDWWFDSDRNLLLQGTPRRAIAQYRAADEPSEELADCRKTTLVSQPAPSHTRLAGNGLLMSSALAQSGAPISREQISEALRLLEDDNADVRRAARDLLSRVQPEDVRLLLDHSAKNRLSYRTALGISVALTEMLRRDKSIGARLALSSADLEMLLDFASDSDRTLRIYAGEFLFDLGTKEIARLALTRASRLPPDSGLDNGRFNLIYVSQGGWKAMSPAEREELGDIIAAIRTTLTGKTKTLELLNSFATI